MEPADLVTQIANVRAQLAALDAAILTVMDPTVKFYTLDTGQTVTRVERNTIKDLTAAQSSLENRLCTLLARQTGSGATLAVPAW